MMKTAFIILLLIILALVIALFLMGKRSASGEAIGLIDGKLARCPDTPNCVCSEYTDDANHYIAPVRLAGAVEISVLEKSLEALGGSIESNSAEYLSVTFASRLFRFIDDVEVRIDQEQNTLHFRSASRVGRGDMGVNRKRIEQLKSLMHSTQ